MTPLLSMLSPHASCIVFVGLNLCVLTMIKMVIILQ